MGSSSATFNSAADGDALSLSGNTNTAAAKDQAVVLGGAGNRNNLGIDASGNANSTITVGYDAAQFQSALQSVGTNLNNALTAQSTAGSNTLGKVLDKISTLAESRQTDGVSGLSKTALWGLGIVAVAVIAWVAYRK